MRIGKRWIASLMAALLLIQSLSVIDFSPLQAQKVYANTIVPPTQTSSPTPTQALTPTATESTESTVIPKSLTDAHLNTTASKLKSIGKTDVIAIHQLDASTINLSAFSNQLIAYNATTTSAISIPLNVIVATTDTTLEVSWDSIAEAESYDISLDDNITHTTALNYIYNSLEPNTQHTIKVRAVNQGGNSEWNTEISKYTLLATPINIVTTPSSISIDLAWEATAGATDYEVYRDNVKIGTSSTNSYSDSGLIAGESYVYRIKAYNEAGNVSALSEPLTVSTTAATTPAAISIPANVIVSTTDTTLEVSWDSIAEAESYDISLDDNITNVTASNYTYRSLEPNTQHIVKVRAVNQGEYSEWSKEISKYTLLATPINLVTTPSSISIDLEWEATAGATGYEVLDNESARSNEASALPALYAGAYEEANRHIFLWNLVQMDGLQEQQLKT